MSPPLSLASSYQISAVCKDILPIIFSYTPHDVIFLEDQYKILQNSRYGEKRAS
jgi:hypothetical protein